MSVLGQSSPTRRPHLLDQAEIRFAIAIAGAVVTTLVVCLLQLSRAGAFGALLVVTVLLSLSLRPTIAAGAGLVSWALFTGFVVNSLGQLSFRPDDVRALGVLVSCCPLLASLSRLLRRT